MSCALCGTEKASDVHTLRLKTGRQASVQDMDWEKLSEYRWKHTWVTQYSDVQSHTYTLCHRCWAVARRRAVFLIVSPVLVFIAYVVALLFVHQPSGTTFLMMLAAVVLMVAIVVPIAKSRDPWHRLKRLVVQERGGSPFVVFEGSKDGSDMILPL